jgi:hypothetical protein
MMFLHRESFPPGQGPIETGQLPNLNLPGLLLLSILITMLQLQAALATLTQA